MKQKELSKKRLHYKEHLGSLEVYNALFKRDNPYEKAIIGCELLNHQTDVLFQDYLNDKSKLQNDIFDFTFSQKINLLFAIYIIDIKHFNDLKIIYTIRNQFAHFIHELTFDHDLIRPEIDKLSVLKKELEHMDLSRSEKYSFYIADLYLYLFKRTIDAISRKQIDKDPERIDYIMKILSLPDEKQELIQKLVCQEN